MRESNIEKYNLSEVDVRIARKLRERRNELKLSQQQVADYIGVSRANVTHYESGRLKIRHNILKKLSEILGKPVSYFLDDEDTYQESQFVNNEKVQEIISNWKMSKFLESKEVSQEFINDLKLTVEYLSELYNEDFEDIW